VPLTPASRETLLDAARQSLLARLRGQPAASLPVPENHPQLRESSGCFVSLHDRNTHRLRGCVGRLDPHESVWAAVRETARDVLRDPRFPDLPVKLEEAVEIDIEISVLSPPRQALGPLDFDLLNDGIYLLANGRSGFFLPQVARETGWSKEQLLARLCSEKLQLPADGWRQPDAKLFTFQVEVIGPVPLA
jgi:AmmeMemoRadiSam system protein A